MSIDLFGSFRGKRPHHGCRPVPLASRCTISQNAVLMPRTPVSKPAAPTVLATADLPASWEQRSTHRVLEARRDQILERSRQIVAAAYELLDKEGLEGLTIRAVLKKTGL